VAPKTNVYMHWHGDFDYNKENNYIMQSAISYLRIKLRERLREDLGGVYGVNIGGSGTNKPKNQYAITVSFNADPDKADELIKAAKQVLDQATMEGPSEEEITKIKETQRQGRIKGLEKNSFWSSRISSGHENEKDFSHISLEALEKKIESLTAEQIKSAIKKYFVDDNFIEIIMTPELKKP